MAISKEPSIPAHEADLPKWIWCLVANVRDYPIDEMFNVIERERRGTKHFGPGTRVYVYPVQWGDGWERMVVVGKERGTHRFIRKIMASDMLDDFRLKKVYSPTIINWMCGTRMELIRNCGNTYQDELPYVGWDNSDHSKNTIEEMVDSWRRYKANPAGYMKAIWLEWESEFGSPHPGRISGATS